MGRSVAIWAVLALTGCASTPPDIVEDARPAVTIECLMRPNAPRDQSLERCKLVSVSPDTPDVRQKAEAMLGGLPASGRRSPSEDLSGAETIRFTMRLNPEAPATETTTGDGPGAPRYTSRTGDDAP